MAPLRPHSFPKYRYAQDDFTLHQNHAQHVSKTRSIYLINGYHTAQGIMLGFDEAVQLSSERSRI